MFSVVPTLAYAVPKQPTQNSYLTIRERNGWKMIESDDVTILFPRDGKKPIFLWWYKNETDKIYVVKYQGLIEYFPFLKPFYMRRHRASAARLHELFIKPKENEYNNLGQMMKRNLLRMIWPSPGWEPANWHPPYLPFSACEWNLTDWGDITRDGTVVGLKFNFTLVNAPPHFRFAENNITIRCRLYKTTVTEHVDNLYNYTVQAGELKMDFVINSWKWNIENIRPQRYILQEEHGITIPTPRLALWINLASIDTKILDDAEEEPESIEEISTASHMMVGDKRVFIKPNNTETQDERPIVGGRGLYDHCKLHFAKEDQTLAGFFKFVASAKVTDLTTNNAESKNVTASYIEAGGHMRLFIGYPYFGNKTLEHDPSLGIEVILPFITPLITPELIMILVGAASIIAVAIGIAKWRRRVINVVGVS